MNDTILSAIISGVIGFVGALLGAFVGGKFNIKASMNATQRSIDAQNEVNNNAKILEQNKKTEEIKNSIRMIYLDLTSTIWESWLTIKNMRPEGKNISMIPMNTQYAKSISLISDEFNVDELILINKIYGMIEKIRSDIFKLEYDSASNNSIITSTGIFLLVLYEDKNNNYGNMVNYNVDLFTKDFALDSLNSQYKLLLNKLKEKSGLV